MESIVCYAIEFWVDHLVDLVGPSDENKREKSVINLRENWFDLLNEQPEKREKGRRQLVVWYIVKIVINW